MDEKFMQQVLAEIMQAQRDSLAILVSALCHQVDPGRLTNDLRKQIAAAKMLPSISPLAIDIATHAQAAAEAERTLQARPPGEGPHPKRGQ